jgi:signal transduction histidine kinase
MLETERARIARELHDSLGQKVALLQLDLDRVARSVPAKEQEQLRQLLVLVADVARELHDVAYELHPLRLEILGLPKSIEALCRESARQSGIEIAFARNAGVPDRPGAREALCLYRIAQEALHNVVKHSHAASASVHLLFVRGGLELVVADTGQGFSASAATSGLGLTSMRQRAELLKGTIAVLTRRGGGTRVCVHLPWRQDAATDRGTEKRTRPSRAAPVRRVPSPPPEGGGVVVGY